LPVSVAAAIAYGSLVSAEKAARNPAELDEHLNLVAKALATVISVYSVTVNGTPVILSPEEVARGRFADGAQVLHLVLTLLRACGCGAAIFSSPSSCSGTGRP
jgi:hypothetical protein